MEPRRHGPIQFLGDWWTNPMKGLARGLARNRFTLNGRRGGLACANTRNPRSIQRELGVARSNSSVAISMKEAALGCRKKHDAAVSLVLARALACPCGLSNLALEQNNLNLFAKKK